MYGTRILALLLAGAALCAPRGALAQTTDSIVITYERALELALEQSITLERARNDLEMARLSVSQARTSFLPDLRLSISGDQSYGRSFNEDEGRVLNETNESMSGRVSTGVTLFDGFANVSELDAANLGAEAALFQLERTR